MAPHVSITPPPLRVKVEPNAPIGVGIVRGGPPGPQGPPGPPGPQGPAGETTETLSYRHVQGVPAAIWTIVHPLNFMPNVTIVNSAGEAVEGAVDYTAANTVQVSFSNPFSGEAYLS